MTYFSADVLYQENFFKNNKVDFLLTRASSTRHYFIVQDIDDD